MALRARRAGLRATPRNSRKKAKAEEGRSEAEKMATFPHRWLGSSVPGHEPKKAASECTPRLAEKRANRVKVRGRPCRSSAEPARASVTMAASSLAWVRMSTHTFYRSAA